ncbi:hypothetical protein [Paractinoplanes durhamensis]|uniref:Uncharacterized protein n=1 Tax=Paractinoplanes durhamensis TaxID=113563 RepID=A0ABQ3YPK2_9ACTN|nr:hypothetical protein Adu01nite_08160 [Actinoplanes durhamensis]
MIYLGKVDRRQPEAGIDGRADLVQLDIDAGREGASTEVDRAASTVTRAASSKSVGAPRTTLTSGSLSIDRAYDV